MSFNEKGSMNSPPPYSHSHSMPYPSSNPLQNLAQARTTHLNHIIHASIIPPIYHRASLGISRTTIALLPSSSTSTSTTAISSNPFRFGNSTSFSSSSNTFDHDHNQFQFQSQPQVLGLASTLDSSTYPTHTSDESSSADAEMIQIQLEGPMNHPRFWSQKTVLTDLQRLLGETLSAERTGGHDQQSVENDIKDSSSTVDDYNPYNNNNNHNTYNEKRDYPHEYSTSNANPNFTPLLSTSTSTPTPELPPRPQPSRPQGSFLSRLASRTEQRMDAGEDLARKNEELATQRRKAQQEAARRYVRDGVQVQVDLEDVCLRTVSDFGLYETMTRECVVVRVVLE